jgi:hypothetical protein
LRKKKSDISGAKTVVRHLNVIHAKIIHDYSPNNVVPYAVWCVLYRCTRKPGGNVELLTTRAGRGLQLHPVTTPCSSEGDIELRNRKRLF